MRYYDLRLFDPQGKIAFNPTTHPGGKLDPAALLIEFDAPTSVYAAPVGAVVLTVHGVPLEILFQARHFGLWLDESGQEFQAPYTVELFGGMKAGLPLANPKQSGLLLSGVVLQSWGNWEGTDMTLDLLISGSGGYSVERPAPLVLVWRKGMELADALRQCLALAFPNAPLQISIRSGLVQDHDEIGTFSTLEQLGRWVEQFTRIGFRNPVHIAPAGAGFAVFDKAYKPTPIQLAFTDFVGQPTWLQPRVMQVKLVLRGDLSIGSIVKLPQGIADVPGIVLTAPRSYPGASQAKNKSTFAGDFQIVALRHIGNSRSPDGASWATVANCVPLST